MIGKSKSKKSDNVMKKYICVIIMAIAAVLASAQNTAMGYFLDGYLYGHQINPAIGNSQGYVSMPALGNVNVSQRGNLSLTDVIYNVNGKTTTFLNPEVSASEVMGSLKTWNRTAVDIREEILSVGFKGIKGYNTISVNVRGNVAAKLPKELFRLLKEGATNDTYDISGVRLHSDAYAEVALNHSHAVSRNVRVGVTLKGLVGIGNVDADLRKAQLSLGEDYWTATTDAEIRTSINEFSYKTSRNNRTGHEYVDGADVSSFGVAGYGAALDLGVVVSVKDFEVSAALLDIGVMSWRENRLASTGGEQTVITDKYTFNVDGDAGNNFGDEIDRIGDDLAALYELSDMGNQGGRTLMLSPTVNFGAKYTLPNFRALSFGVLNTTHIQSGFAWTEFRASVNYAPCRFFAMAVGASAGTNGAGLGWMINLHPKGFGLFAGMDYSNLRFAKQGVPLSSNTSVNVGINIPF